MPKQTGLVMAFADGVRACQLAGQQCHGEGEEEEEEEEEEERWQKTSHFRHSVWVEIVCPKSISVRVQCVRELTGSRGLWYRTSVSGGEHQDVPTLQMSYNYKAFLHNK
ncbi:hypothetical protein Baya_1850 [Bagarius yarrelli]|uniref:Uncharacterized protein n=1 Tax=Bagarius yarrelli TaxID=175774 RepID=A0A556TMB4_BAGYA|nr:hypothetical protein Baya_1850 [Bagarius yarrelli]